MTIKKNNNRVKYYNSIVAKLGTLLGLRISIRYKFPF